MASSPASDEVVAAAAEAAAAATEGKGKEKEKRAGVLGRVWRALFGGREDFEKRLQYLSKEEAAVHARMRRRTQFSRRAVRNLIVLSVLAEGLVWRGGTERGDFTSKRTCGCIPFIAVHW